MNTALLEFNREIEKNKNILSTHNYNVDLGKKELVNIVGDVIDRGSNYVIKSLPCPDAYKDILMDVKENFKTKGFKDLLKTVVASTAREGLEILGLTEDEIKNLTGLEKSCEKGGLNLTLSAVIGVVEKDFLDRRIVGDYVNDYFAKLKEYVLSNKFLEKLRTSVNRYDMKSSRFVEKCDEWYKAYNEKDTTKILEITDSLSKNITNVRNNSECKSEYEIINNLTKCYIDKNNILEDTDINIIKNI